MPRAQPFPAGRASLPPAAPASGHLPDPASLLADIIEHPPALPGWSANTWRRILGSGQLTPHSLAPLSDKRLARLLAWVAAQTDPKRQIGAVADVLAVVDKAVHDGELDAIALAQRVLSAATTARPVIIASTIRTADRPLPRPEHSPTPPLGDETPANPGMVELSEALLHQAGFDLRANAAIAGRLGAALDVAINHWLEGAEQGGGLPTLPHEHSRFYSHRLIVKLGADRDLLRLVAGPQPGRGRDRQTAWQRGLAYWVAISWIAREAGEPPPSVPSVVLGHWRKELETLVSVPPEPDVDVAISIAGMKPRLRGDGT